MSENVNAANFIDDFWITMLLADAVQTADGKLFILGGGWDVIGPGPAPMAIAASIRIPWNETNRVHKWKIELFTQDGEAVLVDTQVGPKPLSIEGELEAGRPPGVHPGTPMTLQLGLNFGPMPLKPGSRYVWKASICDKSRPEWSLPFSVRSE